MRRKIIAGNWKMNKTIGEAIELVSGLKRELYDKTGVDIVVCPPFTVLSDIGQMLNDSNIELGAQDVHWEDRGAFTGELSASMLKDVGCKYVIIGHSERRQFFFETNETINKKVKAVLKAGLLPIVCVGEKLSERENGKTFEVVRNHIENGLKDLSGEEMLKVIIAYEPVWAIGTGKNATAQQAEEVHLFIRKLISEAFDEEISLNVRIQYGGSVKPDNISDLIKEEDIDGALVGGASLNLDSFGEIVKKCLPY